MKLTCNDARKHLVKSSSMTYCEAEMLMRKMRADTQHTGHNKEHLYPDGSRIVATKDRRWALKTNS